MNYKINSSLLPTKWFEDIIFPTLDMYCAGKDLSESPFVKYGRNAAMTSTGHIEFVGVKKKDVGRVVSQRQESLLNLFESTKKDGYTGSVMLVWFDDNGFIQLYDGYHRICVMKYLGIEEKVNVTTDWAGLNGAKGRDFPLVEVLLKEHPVGKWLYQPVADARLKDFEVDRKDSAARLEYILKHIKGSTVLEIGCSEGYFARELSKREYKVTAIDKSPGYIAAARYLATIENTVVAWQVQRWQDFLKNDTHFDNILFLSVLHNDMKFIGARRAIDMLGVFRDRADRVFMEVPNNEGERDWSASRYNFHDPGSIKEIESKMGMRMVDAWNGLRKIMVLEAGMDGISLKEWLKHNAWERNWWGDCRNTFEEQEKQDAYAKYMKLDQYAIHRKSFNLQGKSVLDIGGGPCSLLLRCWNFSKAVVVDPCAFPKWVADRYESVGIEYIKERAETVKLDGIFDEAWIYNVLQHVQDPVKVVELAKKHARKVRIFEPLEVGVCPGHPFNLTKEYLDGLFGREGLIDKTDMFDGRLIYFGVFRYGQ